MKVYHGQRTDRVGAVTVEDGMTRRALDLRFDLRNHSPTGAEWGYAGSGPAQLALALAADVLGDDDRARDVYQQLKFQVVAGLCGDSWTLTEDQVRQAIEDIERARGEESRGSAGDALQRPQDELPSDSQPRSQEERMAAPKRKRATKAAEDVAHNPKAVLSSTPSSLRPLAAATPLHRQRPSR